MQYAALLSLLVLSVLAKESIYGQKRFFQHSGDQLIKASTGQRHFFLRFDENQCIDSFELELEQPGKVEVQVIVGRETPELPTGAYIWKTIGEVSAESTEATLTVSGKHCPAQVRFISDSTIERLYMHGRPHHEDEEWQQRVASTKKYNGRKRDIPDTASTCPSSAIGLYSNSDCQSSGSPLCVALADTGTDEDNLCGCRYDADCYQSTTLPYCNVRPGSSPFGLCGACYEQTELTAENVQKNDHLWCRKRYPSIYAYRDNTFPNREEYLSLTGEVVQIPNSERFPDDLATYKEVCLPEGTGSTSGGCQTCFNVRESRAAPFLQAVGGNSIWPGYQPSDYRGAYRGTFFCHELYSTTVTALFPNTDAGTASQRSYGERPICGSEFIFLAAGICSNEGPGGQSTTEVETCENDDLSNVWRRGQVTLQSNEGNNDASTLSEFSDFDSEDVTLTPYDFEGACMPCSIREANGGTPALPTYATVPTDFHSLCSIPLPTYPICTAAAGCSPCTTDLECFPEANLQTATAASDGGCHGRGQCTGGPNCQEDGRCYRCLSNADCEATGPGGGDTDQEVICNTATGRCEAPPPPFSCTTTTAGATRSNADANAACAAENSATPNCLTGGTCNFCNSNADCTSDFTGQRVCGPNGICVGCALNANSVANSPVAERRCDAAAGGPNCYFDGSCRNCNTGSNGCAATTGANRDGGADSPANINDANDQTICYEDGICRFACSSQSATANNRRPNVFCEEVIPGVRSNCHKDGQCYDCRLGNTFSNPCGTNGVLDGGAVPDQSLCDADTGICETPFQCGDNVNGVGSDLCNADANNCQTNRGCLDCSVTRTGTTTSIQSTCGALDGGNTPGQPNCNQDNNNRVCVGRCNAGNPSNQAANNACSGTQGANCMTVAGSNDGLCISCIRDSDCSGAGVTNAWGSDYSGNTVCNVATGICEDPFRCASNQGAGSVVDTRCTTADNCQADQTCRDCSVTRTGTSTSIQSTCGALDGGLVAGQPNCRQAANDRVCVSRCNAGNPSNGVANAACAGTQGANCMTVAGSNDGLCISCVRDSDCSGAGVTNAWGSDYSGNTICDLANGICIDPFFCDTNVGIGATGGQCGEEVGGDNCQKDRSCRDCSVTRNARTISSTCAGLDGGNAPDQPNCNQDANNRVCRARCNAGNPTNNAANAACSGTQGANCMTNPNSPQDGVCISCTSDADCSGAGNEWGTDFGGQGLCNIATGICFPACASNAQCGTGISGADTSGANCDDDGRCRDCDRDNSNPCPGADGPPGLGTNTECSDSGICVDPYCYANSDCANFANSPGANCYDGGVCGNCQSDADCQNNNADGPDRHPDGNLYGVQNQPNCDRATGICVSYCTEDAHCDQASCEPFCQKDRGCCVECLTDSQCPHQAILESFQYQGRPNQPTGQKLTWRNDQETYTQCNTHTHTCDQPTECRYNSDCSGSTPACDIAAKQCVACTDDSHCASGYCNVASKSCINVECVHNICPSGTFCVNGACFACLNDDHCPDDVMCRNFVCEASPASTLVASALVVIVALMALL